MNRLETVEKEGLIAAVGLFFSLLIFPNIVAGAVQMPGIIGDNMVLQQMQPVPIWGWSSPGTAVTVRFATQVKKTVADASGRWEVDLRRLQASREPGALVIEAGETLTFTNILVGEVWLCSGQSNMEKPIGCQPGQQPCFNSEQELAAAEYPQIRLFKVEKDLSAAPKDQLKKFSGWQFCNSNTLNTLSFSAAGYFFGREIHTNLDVPVGLIESSWGGTRIEPWTPAGSAAIPALPPPGPVAAMGTNRLVNTAPAVIYNAMIAPLVHFTIRGVLWYQGESNCMGDEGGNYTDQMAALVGGWRQAWGRGNFPFYYVQIAPFKYFGGKIPRVAGAEALPEFWEQQARAQSIPNTGMVVTTDLVNDLNDIHPRNKADVGRRLARIALAKTYGHRDVVCFGPAFKHFRIKGRQAVLTFDNPGGGLVCRGGGSLNWFTIAGDDGKFVPADAVIDGDTVVVSAAGVDKPAAVRFAWDESAQPNFFNQAGLPAVPFRTDSPAR
jgi:sialate O-acetylesterase